MIPVFFLSLQNIKKQLLAFQLGILGENKQTNKIKVQLFIF